MSSSRLIAAISVAMICPPLVQAQLGRFFPPATNGDGIRYPLVLSPAIWEIDGRVAVMHGSDGLVHLAYALRITNVLGGPMKIILLQIVDPFADYKQVGKNQVLAVDNRTSRQSQSCSGAAHFGQERIYEYSESGRFRCHVPRPDVSGY
jgi:hypothetical protein